MPPVCNKCAGISMDSKGITIIALKTSRAFDVIDKKRSGGSEGKGTPVISVMSS